VIPAGTIHKRWTVTTRDTGFAHPTIGTVGHLAVDDVAGRRNLLYLAAMDPMREGAVSNEGYKALTEVKHVLRVMREDPSDQSPGTPLLINNTKDDSILDVTEEVTLLPPLKMKGCSRPATVRLKSRADYYGNKQRKTRGIAECYAQDEPKIPVNIGDIIRASGTAKRQAKCGLCGVSGHIRQTCGKK
jgi:hypothetical protein